MRDLLNAYGISGNICRCNWIMSYFTQRVAKKYSQKSTYVDRHSS